jgi:hypothetical protein
MSRGEQYVQPGARPEVQDDLARRELSEHRRVATAKADGLGKTDLFELVGRVRAAASAIGTVCLAAPHSRLRLDHSKLLGYACIPGSNRLFDFAHE